MYVKNELARSNAYYGAWALNTGAPELPVAASAARIAASEAFWFASKENIQTYRRHRVHLGGWTATSTIAARGSSRSWPARRGSGKERLVSHLERRNAEAA
jgi:hypothetical protein